MQSIAGFPFLPLEFTKDGRPDAAQKRALLDALPAGIASATDLFVLSHGWNNDMGEARALYQQLLTNMRRRLDGGHPTGGGGDRRFAVLGIYWPSKKFADAALRPDANPEGVAMSFGGEDIPSDVLRAALDQLGSLLDLRDDPRLGEAKEAADSVGTGTGAEDRFVSALRALLPQSTDSLDDSSDLFFTAEASDLITALEPPVSLPPAAAADEGGAAAFGDVLADPDGGAAGLIGSLTGRAAGALRLLNYATYYVMKERAGIIGLGLNGVLGDVRSARPDLKLHLVGHSFGARVVTAAADGPNPIRPSSLSLLQGAFSHNAFAEDVEGRTGFFRGVVRDGKVAGPIIATHTRNDVAVGIAYAIASRLSNDVAAGLGGPDDIYGGIGRNGAMRLAATEHRMADLAGPDAAYPAFQPGVVVNLRGDGFISGHSDVGNPAVANAVLSAAR